MDTLLENLIMTDRELADLARNNPDYFGILVERYESKIGSYIKRITHVVAQDHEDIIQNIFIKAYININSFDRSLSFSSWMYRIAHNEAIDWSRKSKTKIKYGHHDHDDEVFNWTADNNHFLQELEVKENNIEINNILNTLDSKYREVLYLKFIEGTSYRDMSDILKKPEGTIATLINRAKKQFKNHYENRNQ